MPDFKAKSEFDQAALSEAEVSRLLDAGRAWDLSSVLTSGGAIIFPHATISVCGHHIAAAVHACLDSGARRVLALGVLHALTPELTEARNRVAAGGDPQEEPSCGLQGPGLPGREDWRKEFSLSHFQFLWEQETMRRGIAGPELILRYPHLVCGRPDLLPGIEELKDVAKDAVIVATIDPFHHGIGYGEPAETALFPESSGLTLARANIETGLELLRRADYPAYNRHCIQTRSDGRDVGQVLRHLIGPLRGEILDLLADDMTGPYNAPAPTWVAGALIAVTVGESV